MSSYIKVIIGFSILVFGSSSNITHASSFCPYYQEDPNPTFESIVFQTKTIVTGRVVSFEKFDWETKEGSQIYYGQTLAVRKPLGIISIEKLSSVKGSSKEVIEIIGFISRTDVEGEAYNTFYNAHSDPTYYANPLAGTTQPYIPEDETQNCIYIPRVIIGETYVMFLDRPFHAKSFEPIPDENDPFLQKVFDLVEEQESSK